MAVELNLTDEASQDVNEAYNWYETRRVGLGEEFLGCFEACTNTIRRSPEAYAKVYGDFRRGLVRRFPFAVFYEYTDGKVTVYRVFHTSQDPEKWRRSLK